MASETKIGQLVIDLKIKTEALESGLETAKSKLQQLESQNKQLENSNSQVNASYLAMSAGVVASLAGITSAVTDAVGQYHNYVNSMKALEKTAQATGNTMSDVQNIIKDVNSLKLMDEADLNTSIKNLMLYGYTAEQTADILKVLQDSAVGNRQANYSLSEAVRVTTEGIRMENSVLSDAAGVQKNISKMYKEYAAKIGKTVNALTQADKAQAVYNGIMAEASIYTGAAADMAEGYQGQQAQLNAANLELSRTIGESMTPALTQYSTIQLTLTKQLTEFIKNHKTATSGVITFTTTLLAMVVALTAAKKAYVAYKAAADAANMTTKAFTASLLINPIMLIVTAVATTATVINHYNSKLQETIDKEKEFTENTNTFVDAMNNAMKDMQAGKNISEQDKDAITKEREKTEIIVGEYNHRKKAIQDIQDEIDKIENDSNLNENQKTSRTTNLYVQLNKAKKELKDYSDETFTAGRSAEFYTEKLSTINKLLSVNETRTQYATATNQKAHRETLINIAQTKADIEGKRQLLNILKKGKTETEAYKDAKSQLVKVYPELAKVNDNTIASTEDAINAEDKAADAEWANAQVAIQASLLEVQAMAANKAQIKNIAAATQQSVDEVTASLQNQIQILGNLAKLTPADFKGSVTPSFRPKPVKSKGSGSKSKKSYENKALDNYKKQIEYKKSLDQISLKEEIAMYETALRKYAKTVDEKNELRTKIYELNKELAQKEKELLEQQTEDYEAYIQEQKNLRGAAYDINEQTRDYNKIIQMHKNYLNQIMYDERLSLDERKEIYREELQTIRDYEQQKRDLRVEQIDNTVTQLTNAITKQLEEMQKNDKEMIDKNIEEVEKWKEARINAINEEYDARIEAINKELEALDKAEKQKTREEEDAEYEKKKKRLEELVAFEHDATTKANYQKELDKLIAEYQKTLDKRALEDKKEALNEQKDLLEKEQDEKTQAVEDEVEKQKEIYNKQLEDLEKYYEEQMDMAQETAEKMLINVDKNQEKILNLLKTYGNAYEITGQSLGEKLGQGINEGLANKIENIVQRIQDTIDAGIENKLAQIASSAYKYEAGANKPQSKIISITQQNYIEQNPELPSETYRKLNNVSEKLAAEIAGV